jgi:hypothetical protein
MATSAASETSARNRFTVISTVRGIRATSGAGGGGPGLRCRQIAAPKQNMPKAISFEASAWISYSGKSPVRRARAPTPLASANSPVRTQAA